MRLSSALFFLALSFSSAQAMPQMAGQASSPAAAEERFAAMDADHNGAVTWQEFSQARPNINKNAFTSIDADHNDLLDLQEWKAFSSFHSARQAPDTERMMRAMKEGAMSMEGGLGTEGTPMPLVMPPAQQTPADLPLVTPPAGK